MANIIERVKVGGTVHDIASTAYRVSSQAANDPEKTINIDGFALETGVTIHVKFANANTAPNPTLTVSGSGSTGNSAVPIVGRTVWPAGALFTLTYDGTNWVQDYDEIITNGITGSGTSGSLVKFNGTNSITNGPALGNDATKFLNNKGEWVTPNYTTNTDEKVTQTGITSNAEYSILLKHSTGTTDETTGVNYGKTSNKLVTINPSTGRITAPGGLEGNASTASELSSNTSITLSGDVSGSVSAKKDWNITTTIGEGKVTNAMLAGSITNNKLANHSITIGNVTKNLGETFTLDELGISAAMHFKGTTTTALSDDATTSPITINSKDYTPNSGDVVLYSGKEYVWTGSAWEQLGDESSWALNSEVIKNTGSKGDILYWSDTNTPTRLAKGNNGQVLKINSNGVPAWSTDNNDNTKVTQNILTTSATDTYPLLVSYYKTTGTDASATTAQTANRVAAIYVQPSTGTLTATKFVGDGSGITNLSATAIKTALDTGSTSDPIFLHKSGAWKTLKVSVTANNNGSVVTNVGFNQGAFPTLSGGVATKAEVVNAVLEITAGSNASLSTGTLPSLGTISRANLTVSYT